MAIARNGSLGYTVGNVVKPHFSRSWKDCAEGSSIEKEKKIEEAEEEYGGEDELKKNKKNTKSKINGGEI